MKTKNLGWRYVETPLAAEIQAGDIVLRPHWKGAIGSDEIHGVVRLASAAPALYDALKDMLDQFYPHQCKPGPSCARCEAMVRGSQAITLVESAKRPINNPRHDGQAS